VARKILLVEDDAMSGQALGHLVGTFGYETSWVANGRDALQAVAHFQYDGVLLDLVLPDIRGIDLLQKVRKLHPTIPILITSGPDSLRLSALAEGAQGFLVKPLDAQSLQGLMKEWFGVP
jgi:two-component system, OmpR family, response regulator